MKKTTLIVIMLTVLIIGAIFVACNATVDYTLSFEVDGDTYHTLNTSGSTTISIPQDPEKEGYTFGGWYWDKDVWDQVLTVNSLFDAPISSNMTVYARWVADGEELTTYTITFNSNGGSVVAPITGAAGTAVSAPDSPTRTDFVFDGWYTDNTTFANEYTFLTMPAQNLTLFANWTADGEEIANYTITFNSNGGSVVDDLLIQAGSTITLPSEPTKVGFRFDGWYYDNNTFLIGYNLSQEITDDTTLYAYWSEVQYLREGNYIWFGEYPQTIASAAALAEMSPSPVISAYYVSSYDDAKYIKVTASPNSNRYVFSNGSSVDGGETYYFKVEPIKWRILDEGDGEALLMAELLLDNYRYNPDTVENDSNWENSAIREWLNNTFYNEVFDQLQKEIIVTSFVDNSLGTGAYSNGATHPYLVQNNTNDKVYILSYQEAINTSYGFHAGYLNKNPARSVLTSDYSRAKGIFVNTTDKEGYGGWWLRSPGHVKDNVSIVSDSGSISREGYPSIRSSQGFLPVIRIVL